jgi:hypothetical protein
MPLLYVRIAQSPTAERQERQRVDCALPGRAPLQRERGSAAASLLITIRRRDLPSSASRSPTQAVADPHRGILGGPRAQRSRRWRGIDATLADLVQTGDRGDGVDGMLDHVGEGLAVERIHHGEELDDPPVTVTSSR